MADIGSILRDGQDVPMPALRAWLAERDAEIGQLKLANTGVGVIAYADASARDAATGTADGQLSYVYLNNGVTDDPENGFWQWKLSATDWIRPDWLLDLFEYGLAATDDRTSDDLAATPAGVTDAIEEAAYPSVAPPTEECAVGVYDPATGAFARLVDGDGNVVVSDGSLARFRRYDAVTWNSSVGASRFLINYDRERVCLLHIHLGQSNAGGYNIDADDDIGNATNPYHPAESLMLLPAGGASRGPRRHGEGRAFALTTLIEGDGDGGKGTAAASFANHLQRDILAERPGYVQNIISMVIAQGDARIEGLCRGQPIWQEIIDNVRDAVELGRRDKGFARFVTVASWDQGENNSGDATSAYLTKLKTLVRHLRADVMAITGEREPFPFFVHQVGNRNGWEHGPTFAAIEAHGQDGIVLVGPRYQHPMADGDTIHLSSNGQNMKGQQLARAVREEMFGIGWNPMLPTEYWWDSSTVIKLRIGLPYPNVSLVNDTSGSIVSTTGLSSSGFTFDDGSGSPPGISSVGVAADIVTITLASAATGKRPRLGYALFRNAGAGLQDGPALGARGTIRGDAQHTAIYSGPDQYDWLAAFKFDLRGA